VGRAVAQAADAHRVWIEVPASRLGAQHIHMIADAMLGGYRGLTRRA
jgi:hypothetical protein